MINNKPFDLSLPKWLIGSHTATMHSCTHHLMHQCYLFSIRRRLRQRRRSWSSWIVVVVESECDKRDTRYIKLLEFCEVKSILSMNKREYRLSWVEFFPQIIRQCTKSSLHLAKWNERNSKNENENENTKKEWHLNWFYQAKHLNVIMSVSKCNIIYIFFMFVLTSILFPTFILFYSILIHSIAFHWM